MMNVNISPRRGVRVAPATSDEYTVTVVTPAEVTARNAAFEAAYAAAAKESHLGTLLAEAGDALQRVKDARSVEFLKRAITALEGAITKMGKEHEPVYRAAEAAGEKWGGLFEHGDMLYYWGQVSYDGCGLRNQGLRAIAWAHEHGAYPEVESPAMETYFICGHIRAIGRG